MKGSDKRILLIVGGLVAVAVLWFMLISPKRAELGTLDEDVTAAQAEVSEQELVATTAAAAKDRYESDYRELVTLGKAVPADDDASSLIDQIDGLARDTGVEFLGLTLAEGAGSTDAAQVAPPPPLTEPGGSEGSEDSAESSEEPASGDAAATASTTAAPATEATAADLPLGATVGPAGLPIMPYSLTFRGTFFEVADFLAAIDAMVRTNADGVTVEGRLLTVDSIDLHPDEAGSGELAVGLEVTSYVAPADQGATAGASPTTPASPTGAPAAPATSSTGTAPPTATTTAPTP